MVIVNFIRDKEVGMFARAKRIAKEAGCSKTGEKTPVLEKALSREGSDEESDKSE
jgi:hypothetical protein